MLKKIIATILIFMLMLTLLVGCGKETSSINDELNDQTSEEETTIDETNNSPKGITVNKIDFNKITDASELPESVINFILNNKEKRGYTYFEYEDGYMLLVFMGEKNTGGYGIEVVSVEDNEGKTNVIVKETAPNKGDMVITVITYPYTIVTMKGVTNNFNVVNEDGGYFEYIESGETE
jgi:hypothetical protein